MSAAATPIPGDTTPNTATRITNVRSLTFVRVLWFALLALELIRLAYLVPINLTPQGQQPDSLAILTELNILQPILYLNVTIAIISMLIATGLSTLLMWRSRNERTAILFSFVVLTWGSGTLSFLPNYLPPLISQLHGFLSSVSVMTILYLFPDQHFSPRWMRFLFAIICLALAVNYMFAEVFVGPTPAFFFSGIILGIGSFLYRFRHTAAAQRQQIKWIVPPIVSLGLVIIIWMLDFWLVPAPTNLYIQQVLIQVSAFVLVSFPFAIGLAVLRYRLWETDLVINRSLVYGAVTVLLALVFGVSVLVIQSVLGAQNTIASLVVSAIGPLVLFNPARKRVQRFVDHYLYRLRFDLNELAAAQKAPLVKNPGALTGKTLGGYQVLDFVGKGGMGEVYKGFKDGETIALKILPQELAQQEEFRKRFAREAEMMQTLQHPHIVKLLNVGDSDGTHFLAMEYIDGYPLDALLKQRGKLSLDEVRDILNGLCAALDYAHAQGLVHRDIKPSNVMLRLSSDQETQKAVLMDFGIAKIKDAHTRYTGSGAIGTIDYMAPEQIMAAKEVDARADIYALGVMLYEMITGTRPFEGGAAQVMFAHLQQPAPDPRDVNPELPRTVAKAVMQALSKNPDDRFATAGELAQAVGG